MSIFRAIIHPATPEIDSIIAEHFYQLWLDNNISANLMRDDWRNITLGFIQQARQESVIDGEFDTNANIVSLGLSWKS